jgi:uncharacterized protein
VNMRRGFWAGLLVAGVLSLPALAADFSVPPVPAHYVTDNAGALSIATQATVDGELKAYARATGHQVIVWIGDTTGDVPLETWTGETAQEWHVGRRGKDDGAILFLFMSDRKVRIEVGYGLEGSLTDADASRIIRNDVVPRMKANDPNGAVSSGVAAMLTTITPSYAGVTPPPAEDAALPLAGGTALIAVLGFFGLFGLFIAFFVFIIVLAGRKGARGGRSGTVGSALVASSDRGSSWTSSSSDDSSSSSDDDFSSGGGDFGGGGASGSW